MKKALKRIADNERCWHFVDGKQVYGLPAGLWGDVSGLRGNVTDLRGDVNECGISEAERAAGVNVEDLVMGEE